MFIYVVIEYTRLILLLFNTIFHCDRWWLEGTKTHALVVTIIITMVDLQNVSYNSFIHLTNNNSF